MQCERGLSRADPRLLGALRKTVSPGGMGGWGDGGMGGWGGVLRNG